MCLFTGYLVTIHQTPRRNNTKYLQTLPSDAGKPLSSVTFVENDSFLITVSLSQKHVTESRVLVYVCPSFRTMILAPGGRPGFQDSVPQIPSFHVPPFTERGWTVQDDERRDGQFLAATNKNVQMKF